jgi:hypothetical protein
MDCEINYEQNAIEYGELLFEKHRLNKLKELAIEWNQLNDSKINIETNDWMELTCHLFRREIKPRIELTFEEPYYSLFYAWSQIDNDDIDDDGNIVLIDNIIFNLYKAKNYLIDFLYYGLNLKMEKYSQIKHEKFKINLLRFNEFWIKLNISNNKPIKNYDEFMDILKSGKLSIFDLIYIVIESENYSIMKNGINMFMVIDRAS